MKSKEFWTKANRKTVVERSDLAELAAGDPFRPQPQQMNHPSEQKLRQAILNDDPIWRLRIYYRTGLDREESFYDLFTSLEAAVEAQEEYHCGTELDLLDGIRPKSNVFNAKELSLETLVSTMGRGETDYFLVLEALQGAGVLNSHNRLAETVLSWIGRSGASKLEEQFGENWETVAALEYCAKHFHPTSLATLAARVQVADFVAPSDYDAGYAMRELEMVYSGAEELAMRSVETRKSAGRGGGEAARQRRAINLEILMQEIEKRAGAAGLISEDRIVAEAFEAAQAENPKMPKTKKTLEDYGTALRSEEPFKSRYEAVFRKNA